MILIVVDTSPINYLIQIGHIDLLSILVDKTVLPSSIPAELLNDAPPPNERAWAANPSGWAQIHAAKMWPKTASYWDVLMFPWKGRTANTYKKSVRRAATKRHRFSSARIRRFLP